MTILQFNRPNRSNSIRGLAIFSEIFTLPGIIILVLAILSISCIPLEKAHSQGIFETIRQNREYEAGVSLLRKGDYSLARTQFKLFLDQFPESSYRPRVIFGLAEGHYLDNQYDSAAIQYHRSLSTGDTLAQQFIPTALRRGLKAARFSKSDNVTEALLDRLEKVPESLFTTNLLKEAVRSAQQIKEYERAIRWTRVGERLFGHTGYWSHRRGTIYARNNRLESAVRALQSVPDTSVTAGEARFLLGEIAFQRNHLDTATHYYDSIREDTAHHYEAVYGLGWVAIKRQNYDTAIRQLKKASKAKNQIGIDASLDLARLHRQLDRFNEAKTWYNRTIQRAEEPLKSRVRIEWADYLVEQDKFDDAISHYEQARSLKLKSKKHLIRSYIITGRYEQALEQFRTLQSDIKLTSPQWRYYRALAQFETDDVDTALKTVQSISLPDTRSLRNKIYSLHGSILYAHNQLQDAEALYKRWYNDTQSPEAQYFLGLFEDRSDNQAEAVNHWQAVQESKEEPWASRAAYQLFRIYHDRNNFEKKQTIRQEIKREHLTPRLNVELDLVLLAEKLKQNGYTHSLRKEAEDLLRKARGKKLQAMWYQTFLHDQTPKTWWQTLLLPELRQSPSHYRKLAVPTLRILRNNGWAKISLSVGDALLNSLASAPTLRQIRIEQMRTLTSSGQIDKIPQYFPPENQWKNWSNQQAVGLAEFLHRFYNTQNFPERGLHALNKLTRLASLESPQRLQIDEWKASLELQLERFGQAKSRLNQWPASDLSRSARLNLSIAEFHLGDTTTSLRRIQKLENAWETPPIEYFNYAFRNLRKHHSTSELGKWVDRFKHHSYPDTIVADLLIENALFWIQNDHAPRAISELRLLENNTVTTEQAVQIMFYQGLGYFNTENFDQARQTLKKLQNNYTLDQHWTFRTAQLLTEISLRQEHWKQAYESWKTMDSLDRGGQLGQRLLTARGLTREPEFFSRLLNRMKKQYPEYLPEHQQLYWQGRLHEQKNENGQAIETYRQYFESNNQERLLEVRRRLAQLYETTNEPNQALEQYEILWEETGNPRSLVAMAQQHKKLGNYSRARKLLTRAVDEWPSETGWIHYQLSQIHREQSNPQKSIDTLKIALANAPDTADWIQSARQRLIRQALNQDQLQPVRDQLDALDNRAERELFRAELLRREGNRAEALKVLTKMLEQHDTKSIEGPFQKIASAIYFENNRYESVLSVIPDTPPTHQQTELALLSSLQTKQPKQAERLLDLLPSDRQARLAQKLGQFYFTNKQWDQAVEYFKRAPTEPSNHLKIAQSLRHLNRLEEAYTTLSESFSSSKSESIRALLPSLVHELQILTSHLNREQKSASMLDNHWELVDTNKSDTFAKLGLRWSLEADNQTLTRRFINRIERVSSARFTPVADELEQRKWWAALDQWVDKSRASTAVDTVSRSYYNQRLSLRNGPDTTFVQTTQKLIDTAMKQESVFGPRLQHLLGIYYFQRKQYKQAAVEFSKVSNLFERTAQTDRSQLGLARSYAQLDQMDKAREIFQQLAKQTEQPSVRKEAQQWLEKQR